MALHNSNVLALLNSYNTGKIADNSARQARAAEESVAANRYIAGQLDQSLQLQQRQTEMQHMMLESAARQNRQLNALRQELSEVGFAIEGVGSDIRAQTDLHKQHYDEVKKEKKLKEVLYNFEKYLDVCDKENDKLSAAYGSKKTAEMINATGFTTADLSDKADKKDYDALVERANRAWAALSDDEKENLSAVEKMYFSYLELNKVNLNRLIDETAPLLPLEKLKGANSPQHPPFTPPKLHPLLEKRPDLVGRAAEIRKTHVSHKRMTLLGVAAIILAGMSYLIATGHAKAFENWYTTQQESVPVFTTPQQVGKPIASIKKGQIVRDQTTKEEKSYYYDRLRNIETSDGKYGWVDTAKLSSHEGPYPFYSKVMLVLLIGWGAIALLLFVRVSILGNKYSLPISQLVWAISEHESALEKAQEAHRRKVVEYDAEVAALGEQYQTEATRIKKINDEIEKKNFTIGEKRKEIEDRHHTLLDDLKTRTNNFLEKHKGIQEFLPKLA